MSYWYNPAAVVEVLQTTNTDSSFLLLVNTVTCGVIHFLLSRMLPFSSSIVFTSHMKIVSLL